MKQLTKKFPLLITIIVSVLMIVGVLKLPDGGTMIGEAGVRFGLSIVLIAVLKFAFDINCMKPEKNSIRTGLRFYWPLLAIPTVASVITVILAVTGGSVNPKLVPELVTNFVFTISVGLFEELLFRGILGVGLIKAFKNSKHAFAIAVIVSSFIFGFVHIMFDMDFSNGFVMSQCVLKTLETGLTGAVFFLIFCKTKSLIGAMVCHTLFDFMSLAGNIFMDPTAEVMEKANSIGEYVSSDTAVGLVGMASLFILAVISVIVLVIVLKKHVKKQDIEKFNTFIIGEDK